MQQEPKVLYEDEALLALLKPSGWIVNDAVSAKGQPIVQKWVEKNINSEISRDKELRNGIVHRLDKETSGVLLIAKTAQAFSKLQELFKKRKISKKYMALVHGVPKETEGKINQPVGRLPWRRDRFGVFPEGRSALTYYKTKAVYKDKKGSKFALLELRPTTGRTHQIRIHLKYLGHPIVADSFYAGRKTARDDRKHYPRMFLHAAEISLDKPDTQEKITVQAPLPDDLLAPLQNLDKL